MGIRRIVDHTFREYKRNLWLILIFSFMFVVSMLALYLAPTPTYVSLGGNYLRIGSIPELTPIDIAAVVAAYLVSLFVFSDAVTNINLIIKSNRTLNRIPKEIFKGIRTYATRIFLVYTMAILLVFAINIWTFESQLHGVIYPLLSFFVFMAIFFVPPAIVVDDLDTFRAIWVSVKMAAAKWRLVLAWAVVGLLAISAIEFLSFLLLPPSIAKYAAMALNGIAVIPALTIFQSQLYMEKYGLSP